MMSFRSVFVGALAAPVLLATPVLAAGAPPPAACPRPAAGSVVASPPELYSQNGRLNVNLNYVTAEDADGRTLYCFVTPDGLQSPTLHIKPGETLNINLTNLVPPPPPGAAVDSSMARMNMAMAAGGTVCGAAAMDATSVNLHFHGTNVPPTCHSDEVILTTVNHGETFSYHIVIPPDEPPGLYWYHPHIHGVAEAAVQGGASGALIVDGLENAQPAVSGLPSRVLVIRDQILADDLTPGGKIPAWDISLNYVPIAYPALTPAVMTVTPGRKELWRVLNASADTVADVHLRYDGVEQPLSIVGLDGVPTGSQDGTGPGRIVTTTHILIPTAGRAEFIVTTPSSAVKVAKLVTRSIDTGPYGDNDTTRTLAILRSDPGTPTPGGVKPALGATALPRLPATSGPPAAQRFKGLDSSLVTTRRTLYFSEVLSDPSDPASPTNFFITVDGATPTLFSGSNPPAIVTDQGAVEEWTVENRAQEVHEFHIHQIHFKLEKRNGLTLPNRDQQYLDTVQVPYWTGTGPYPSVTLLMDFRGKITGDFVYHCHILGHEDNGMMAIIRVRPKGAGA